MNDSEKQALYELGGEWSGLTEQAQRIRDRKRAIREIIEPIFRSIIPTLNEELNTKDCPYWFHADQYAGYLVDGDLSFDLHPCSTDEWAAQDEHGGWVDLDRAEEITEKVQECESVMDFCAFFPGVRIRVEYNYCGYFRFQDEEAVGDEGYPDDSFFEEDLSWSDDGEY